MSLNRAGPCTWHSCLWDASSTCSSWTSVTVKHRLPQSLVLDDFSSVSLRASYRVLASNTAPFTFTPSLCLSCLGDPPLPTLPTTNIHTRMSNWHQAHFNLAPPKHTPPCHHVLNAFQAKGTPQFQRPHLVPTSKRRPADRIHARISNPPFSAMVTAATQVRFLRDS